MAALEGLSHMGLHAQSADLFLRSWGREACWVGSHALARASEPPALCCHNLCRDLQALPLKGSKICSLRVSIGIGAVMVIMFLSCCPMSGSTATSVLLPEDSFFRMSAVFML